MVRKNPCLILTVRDVKKIIIESGLMLIQVNKQEKVKVKTLGKKK